MLISRRAIPLMALAWSVGLTASARESETWFQELPDASGLDFVHVRAVEPRLWFPEIMSGGGAWLDYDRDGDLDLYLVQGGELDPSRGPGLPNRLFRNDGQDRFVDTSEPANVGDRRYGMGAAVGDIDGDGFVDLYITNVGRNTLLRNRGDGSFEDITVLAGVGDKSWGTSAAFFDYDGDADLDLFVVNYVEWSWTNEIQCFGAGGVADYCHPLDYRSPAGDKLFRNDGEGRFTDVTSQAGISQAFGNGLGIAVADFNRDGALDVYVANDGMANQLWVNQGDGTFRDQALLLGCSVNMSGAPEAGMGLAVVDVDNDGDLDLFMTHLRQETNTFYLNHGAYFEDSTSSFGLAAASLQRTGFGTGFADFDHDGQIELFIANGRVGGGEELFNPEDEFAEPNLLFRRDPEREIFNALSAESLASPLRIENSRAAIFGDYDTDGDIDLAIVNNGGRLRVLRNRQDGSRHWTRIRLMDSGRGLGSLVGLEDNGRQQWRLVQRAYSYCASNDAAVHFGLGDSDAAEAISVLWTDGRTVRYRDVPVDRQLIVPSLGPGD